MRVIITGGTGLIGRALIQRLLTSGDHDVVVLTRDPSRYVGRFPQRVTLQIWDALSPQGWGHLVDANTVIVNLAGENVANWRWTLTHRRIVLQSRVDTTRAVVQAIQDAPDKPRALLQASAVGYYGSRGNMAIGEITTAGDGWRADVCKQWEHESAPVDALGVRRVILRIGVVIDPEGGALPSLSLANRFMASRIGDGGQWVPWIHNDDVAGAILHLMMNETINGPVNVVAPEPVTNAEFMRTIARVRRWPALIPVPAWPLWLALGEMATAVLDSQRIYAPCLVDSGYDFAYPSLDGALRDLLRK